MNNKYNKFNNENLKNENSYSNFKSNKRNIDLSYSYELGKDYEEELEECSTEKYKNNYSKKCNSREHKKTKKSDK